MPTAKIIPKTIPKNKPTIGLSNINKITSLLIYK